MNRLDAILFAIRCELAISGEKIADALFALAVLLVTGLALFNTLRVVL